MPGKLTPESTPNIWPYPLVGGNQGGEWDPPDAVKDLAVLVPCGDTSATQFLRKEGSRLAIIEVEGLSGAHILSSDGSTRPYGEGH